MDVMILYFSVGDQEWVREAACRDADPEDHDLFFSPEVEGTPTGEELGRIRSETSKREVTAKTRYCSVCPSRVRCALEGWTQEFGVWGGWSPSERNQINDGVYRPSPARRGGSPRRDLAVRLVREGMTVDDVAVKMEISAQSVADYLRQNWSLVTESDRP